MTRRWLRGESQDNGPRAAAGFARRSSTEGFDDIPGSPAAPTLVVVASTRPGAVAVRSSPVPGVARLAIFDLDRTLVRGSSLAVLGRALLGSGLVPARPVVAELIRSRNYARRGEGDGQADALLTRVLSCASGREVEPLTSALAGVVDRVEREVYPVAARLLALHRAAGDVCVVLSASPQDLVEAIGRRLGAHIGIGTRPEVIDGRLTGRLIGRFCHGDGKLARLHEELGAVSLEGATAYADSSSDLPLLRACGDPVAVNPDRALEAVARREGWPVLRLQ